METIAKKYTPEKYYIKRRFRLQNFLFKDDVSYAKVLFMEIRDDLSILFSTVNDNNVSEHITYISIY